MTRRWDLLPVKARVFCVCRRCDGRFRQPAHPFTARPLIYLANPISQARKSAAYWPRWYEEACTSTLVILRTSIRPCEIHAPQQIQRGVVLAQRVRYTPRIFPRRRACMHLFAESWKHASTCRRFWITW
ncbi:hypothetical protein TcCL_NonESM02071 [Trypanosoma cruzi]|nr:hypothetical protein TcCL_NonESM02071 [Trypanosoma cruzi]